MILDQLLIYTSMKHSLLQTMKTKGALLSLDTLSAIRIKSFTLLFKLRHSVYPKLKPTLLGTSLSVVSNFQL